MEREIVPVFFAVDKNYLPYLTVAISSLVDNAKSDCDYKIYVLTDNLDSQDLKMLRTFEKENITIDTVDTNSKTASIADRLPLRDYYSVSIYFRFFIPEFFPQYKKGIYLDSDVVVNCDIKKLYDNELGDNYLGVVLDETVWRNPDFIYYVNKALGVSEKQYFNSGVLLMNLEKFRKEKVEEGFYQCVSKHNFGTVAPDQDYLNYVCKDKVVYLEIGYNKMPLGDTLADDKLYIIHYNMFMKPWKYKDVMFEEYFWKYAKRCKYYDILLNQQAVYTDTEKINDKAACEQLIKLSREIADSDNNYKKILG